MPAEDVLDVLRKVREEVADVLILREATARQLGLEAVYAAAAIGVDQATDQFTGMLTCDLALPVFEDDRAGVLPAGPVLREGGWPNGTRRLKHSAVLVAP